MKNDNMKKKTVSSGTFELNMVSEQCVQPRHMGHNILLQNSGKSSINAKYCNHCCYVVVSFVVILQFLLLLLSSSPHLWFPVEPGG